MRNINERVNASAPEFERGLLASAVARKCNLVAAPENRDLLWWLQYRSWEEGGLAAVAGELITKYPDRIKTKEMAEQGVKPGMICNAAVVKAIRAGFSDHPLFSSAKDFMLRGETAAGDWDIREIDSVYFRDDAERQETVGKSLKLPASYPAEVFLERCLAAANNRLEKLIRQLCLDPDCKLESVEPWYFPKLVAALREHQADCGRARMVGFVATELGRQVCDALNYTSRTRGLTLIEGETGRGKSYAAEAWVSQYPGRARIIEVPPGNDDAAFFRGLARGLGLGTFQNKKIADVRESIEQVLLTGQLLIVLDEGQRLWPTGNIRYTSPKRILWLMSMANKAIPFAIIATNQFLAQMKVAAEYHQWNTAQLGGRITWTVSLPGKLPVADLLAVAKAAFPGVDEDTLDKLAAYTSVSDFCLRVIKNVRERAYDNARQVGRAQPNTSDVRRAMKALIPVYSRLVEAMAPADDRATRTRPAPVPTLPLPVVPDQGIRPAGGSVRPPDLDARPAETDFPAPRRGGDLVPSAPRIPGLNAPLTAA